MSQIVIDIEDGKTDAYQIGGLEIVAANLQGAELDGGHLILMTPDRAIAVNTAISFVKTKEVKETKETKEKSKKS